MNPEREAYIDSQLSAFRDYLQLRDKARTTIRTYLIIVGKFLGKYHGDFAEFKLSLQEKSDNYRNLNVCVIRQYYRFAGLPIDEDLFRILKARDVRRRLVPLSTVQQMVSDLRPHHRKIKPTQENILSWRNYCLVGIFAYTGLRNREACNIRVQDIDFMSKHIWIQGIKREGSRFAYPGPKLMNAIEKYIHIAALLPEDYLFGIQTEQVSNVVHDLTGYSPRVFRRTFATEYYRRVRDIKAVQYAMGHQNVSSTQPYVDFVELEEKKSDEVGLYDY